MGQSNSYLRASMEVSHGTDMATHNGFIRGKTYTLDGERRVNAFLGIPYAKAPVGELRFEKPLPMTPWLGVRDCTSFGPRAIQEDVFWDQYIMPVRQDEDCLHLNVFAPVKRDASALLGALLPVMVFVHGGAFAIHSTANYGDSNIVRNLCQHDVVVVTVQYRLGLLGFLSTGDEHAPGNCGLWDQTAALRWVRENVESFGGDPNNVTVFGQSAGGVSVDLLSLSPHSRHLFDKAICMSGNANADWAVVPPERILAATLKTARRIGYRGRDNDSAALVKFLRAQPPKLLQTGLYGRSAFNREKNGLIFCPVIDGDFLPKPIAQLRKEAPKKTVIVGTTEFEALLFIALSWHTRCDSRSIDKLLEVHIPRSVPDHIRLRRQARLLYLDNTKFSDRQGIARAFVKMYSDLIITNATQDYCQEMVAAGHRVYLYSFDFFSRNGFGYFSYRVPFYGATHCGDLRYTLGKGVFAKFRPDSDDVRMLDFMTTTWTNFAKHGVPKDNGALAEPWLPLDTKDTYRHLSIGLAPRMKADYEQRRAEFWKAVDAAKNAHRFLTL